tara:strand:- start:2823 stop:3095 length:273 start_codon:yes stop_codon:yes gene_type:complete
LKLSEIYNKAIENKRKKYREENPKTDNRYRPSSSGMCARKIYFESIEKIEPDTPQTDSEIKAYQKSQRIMRLGTVVHNEIQKALIEELEN